VFPWNVGYFIAVVVVPYSPSNQFLAGFVVFPLFPFSTDGIYAVV